MQKTLFKFQPFANGHEINVFIETAKDSGSNFKYEPDHRIAESGEFGDGETYFRGPGPSARENDSFLVSKILERKPVVHRMCLLTQCIFLKCDLFHKRSH